jgi:hypothetical protein
MSNRHGGLQIPALVAFAKTAVGENNDRERAIALWLIKMSDHFDIASEGATASHRNFDDLGLYEILCGLLGQDHRPDWSQCKG